MDENRKQGSQLCQNIDLCIFYLIVLDVLENPIIISLFSYLDFTEFTFVYVRACVCYHLIT